MTRFTRSSVHWAESIVATNNSSGVVNDSEHLASGYSRRSRRTISAACFFASAGPGAFAVFLPFGAGFLILLMVTIVQCPSMVCQEGASGVPPSTPHAPSILRPGSVSVTIISDSISAGRTLPAFCVRSAYVPAPSGLGRSIVFRPSPVTTGGLRRRMPKRPAVARFGWVGRPGRDYFTTLTSLPFSTKVTVA